MVSLLVVNFDGRELKRSKIPPPVLKKIQNALVEAISEDTDCRPNKDHNQVVEVGGSRYFVVYEFLSSEEILIKRVNVTK